MRLAGQISNNLVIPTAHRTRLKSRSDSSPARECRDKGRGNPLSPAGTAELQQIRLLFGNNAPDSSPARECRDKGRGNPPSPAGTAELQLRRRFLSRLFACCFLLFFPLLSAAQSEYDVKAAYLYNFGKFVKWPESSTKGPQFLICVIGEDPFNGALESTVTGEKINNKPAVVVHLDASRNASACNILFVSRSEERRARRILDSIDIAGTLTVSDIPGFLDDNRAMIEFVNQGGRIRFNINLAAAQQAGLTLSSDLLKVAGYVKGKP